MLNKLAVVDRLLMNAFNNVNLAGAYIVTSVACAEKLGIERCKWIYVLGGAGTSDHPDCESRCVPTHHLS